MKTLLEQLREWCEQNAFNVEGQDGIKHIVLDQWELDTKIKLLIDEEKDNASSFPPVNNQQKEI